MVSESSISPVDVNALRCEIQDKYREVATNPDQVFHFHNGRPLAEILEYPDDLLDSLPGSLVESFAGTGNPFTLGPLNKGEKVVDVGSGAGFDSLIAAMKVGPEGKVTGIDMTPEMVEKARRNAASVGAGNAEFLEGLIEELPLPDGSMDVAISNGVINLCPDKEAVYLELYRVLKPGGRLMIADIAVQKPVSEDVKRDIDLWTGWIAGALLEAEYVALIERAGFDHVEVGSRPNFLAGAKGEASASQFGTSGITIKAVKPLGWRLPK